MKEISFQATISGCSTKEFFEIACSDSKAIKQFHLENNKDDIVIVSEWDQQSRVVEFTLAMAIPAALKRFVGAEPIRIKEKQTYSWDGEALRIVSIPVVQISMAKSLTTRAELVISDTSEGCQIDVTVAVSASVPWPMQSTVESLMADEAKRTVGEYVDYITKYVSDQLEAMNNMLLQEQQQQQILQEPSPMEIPEAEIQLQSFAEKQAAKAVTLKPALAAPSARPAAQPAPTAVWADARAAVAQSQPVPVGAASDVDVFYDATEGPTAVLDAILNELKQAHAERQEANRLLLSMKESVQQLERTISKEVAFQEGVRYGQRMGSGSLLLSVAAAAAAASAVTAFILTRQASK